MFASPLPATGRLRSLSPPFRSQDKASSRFINRSSRHLSLSLLQSPLLDQRPLTDYPRHISHFPLIRVSAMSASRVSQLPIIDLAPLLNDNPEDEEKRQATSEALHRACVQFGFFYLNIESLVDPKEPEQLAELGREFFSRPPDEKDAIALKNQDGARGKQDPFAPSPRSMSSYLGFCLDR